MLTRSDHRAAFVAKCRAIAGFALFVLALASCNEKPVDSEGGAPATANAVKPLPPIEPLELDAGGYSNRRAQAFGLLARLPADTEGAFGLRNFTELYASVSRSATLRRAVSALAQSGVGVEMQMFEAARPLIETYLGSEVFLALGSGTAVRIGYLDTLRRELSASLLSMLNPGITARGGDPDVILEGLRGPIVAALRDPGSDLSEALRGMEFPPVLVGAKLTDGLDEMIAGMESIEASLPPPVIVSKFEFAGAPFKAWKVDFNDIVTEGIREEINEFLQDDRASAALVAMLREKRIELAYGVYEDYFLISLGSDHEHLSFVSDPRESVLAAKAFNFSDTYLDKTLVGYGFAHKALLKASRDRDGIGAAASALADGLAGGGGAAMTELGGWVRALGAQMAGLAKGDAHTYVGITYMEDGLHGESTGGYINHLQDGKAESRFANLAPADAAVVVSGATVAGARGEMAEMMEVLFSGVPKVVAAYAEQSGQASPLDQYELMWAQSGDHLRRIWSTLKGEGIAGLGRQSGILVDLKGDLPKIPKLPRVIVNEGKIPRIAIASDVADRSKLASAWDELSVELDEFLATIPNRDLQMPGVITNESDHLATHFFGLPFLSNNFLPSLSLNDEIFLLSTSEDFSKSIASPVELGLPAIHGFYMMVNFEELNAFARAWIDLVSRHGEQLAGDSSQAVELKAYAEQARLLLEVSQGVKRFSFNRYQDSDSEWRSSWHLHLVDLP